MACSAVLGGAAERREGRGGPRVPAQSYDEHVISYLLVGKRPISVTLDEENILWLRGRTTATGSRSVSDTLDRIVTEARMSGRIADSGRSVVGTIDIAAVDPLLERADEEMRRLFDSALGGSRGKVRPLPRSGVTKAKRRG